MTMKKDQSTTSNIEPRHPLEPLSLGEIQLTVEVLKKQSN
jgi:Cu2+-containing amine oxidase